MEFAEIQSQMDISHCKLHQALQQVVLLNHTISRLKCPLASQDGLHSPTHQPATQGSQPKLPLSVYVGLRDMYCDLATKVYAKLESQCQQVAELERETGGDKEDIQEGSLSVMAYPCFSHTSQPVLPTTR